MAKVDTTPVDTHAANVEILHSAVEAFRKREIGYRDTLEDLPAAIYTTDAEGRLTYYNKACIEFSGRVPALGDDSWCVTWRLYTIDGQPLRHDECPMAVALKERRAVRGVEAIAERPDGSRISFAPYPTPIFDEAGELLGAVNMLVDITEQKRSQDRLALLAREVDHRANNLLSQMQALIHLTKADDIAGYKRALEGRFNALAKATKLISEERWIDVDLRTIAKDELAAYAGKRIAITGPAVRLLPSTAQALAMIIHELATNALKYGALSAEGGRVELDWTLSDTGLFMLRWQESGGPPTYEPRKKGTGSAVITASVRRIQGEFLRDWLPTGLRCTLVCKAENL